MKIEFSPLDDIAHCKPDLKVADAKLRYRYKRLDNFALEKDSSPGKLVFNRTITFKLRNRTATR